MKKNIAILLCCALFFCLAGTCFAEDAVSSATVDITAFPSLSPHENASTLVIWFSTDDTVKAIALTAADELGADVFEIVPEKPYTEADLAYYTNCRADQEQADDSARPGIAVWPESLEQYQTILIGYPIWHGQAPKILYTLFEGINVSGKTIIPFCTSISSSAGSSADNLHKLTDSSTRWAAVKRIDNHSSAEDIRTWALSLNLPEGGMSMQMQINGVPVTVAWEDNESVTALQELAAGGLTIQMSMYGGFEQVGPIGQRLPSNDTQMSTSSGDIVLYSGNQLVVFYGSNSWAYTRLGKIIDQTPDQMEELLGNGDVEITLLSR